VFVRCFWLAFWSEPKKEEKKEEKRKKKKKEEEEEQEKDMVPSTWQRGAHKFRVRHERARGA
jgi:hypothetical protein